MEALFLDRTACTVPPMYTNHDADGIEWVGLNKSLDSLPSEAGRFLLSTTHRESTEVGPTGLLLNMEYALVPDYHVPYLHYLPYTPIYDQSCQTLEWYQNLAGQATIEEVNHRFRMPDWAIDTCEETHRNMYSCVDAIVRSPLYNNSLTPVAFNFAELAILREDKYEVQRWYVKAKRAILELIAFMNWWISFMPSWMNQLPDAQCKLIEELRLHSRPKRGDILSLPRDWKGVSIPTLLKDDVPVYYPWTQREEAMDNLVKLSPRVLTIYQDAVQRSGQTCLRLDQIEGLSAYTAKLLSFDQFLESHPAVVRYSTPSGLPIEVEEGSEIYIIDRPGWGRRRVKDLELQERYILQFHRRADLVKGKRVITYWRFRPIIFEMTTLEDLILTPSQYNQPLVPSFAEEDPLVVHERYKASYAPKWGQVYNEETGIQKFGAFRGPDALIRLETILANSTSTKRPLQLRLTSQPSPTPPVGTSVRPSTAAASRATATSARSSTTSVGRATITPPHAAEGNRMEVDDNEASSDSTPPALWTRISNEPFRRHSSTTVSRPSTPSCRP